MSATRVSTGKERESIQSGRQGLPQAPLDIAELQESASDAGEQAGVEKPTLVGTKLRAPAVHDLAIPASALWRIFGTDRTAGSLSSLVRRASGRPLSSRRGTRPRLLDESWRGSRWTRVITIP